jgi:hypothetical protein
MGSPLFPVYLVHILLADKLLLLSSSPLSYFETVSFCTLKILTGLFLTVSDTDAETEGVCKTSRTEWNISDVAEQNSVLNLGPKYNEQIEGGALLITININDVRNKLLHFTNICHNVRF